MPTLSVIVPATDRPDSLDACLAAVAAARDVPSDLIVVDDDAATSPAVARNLGATRAEGDVLVFVDADVRVRPDAFERIAAAFAADPELDALFGSYDDDPPGRDPVSGFRNLLHHHIHQQAAGEASTFWAGLGAIRRTTFERLGGFVEHPVEDIELGMRLHAAGGRIRLDPDVQGTHLKRWSLAAMIRTDLLVRGAPWVGLLLRHRSTAGGLNLGWRHRLSALASLALVTAAGLAAAAEVVALALAVGAVATLALLNFSFYRLLARRRGLRQAALGMLLHVVHHLVSVTALVLGLALFVLAHRPRPAADVLPPAESAST